MLKHTLREYQHVGLDWLLEHLEVEKGVWGPHLIVAFTSVMLNWELEFKKCCPGFKFLTYYGSPKDRKLKRQVNIYYIYEN